MSDGRVAASWARFLAARPDLAADTPLYEAFQFGRTPAFARELAELVLAGTKTTTSDLLWAVEAAG